MGDPKSTKVITIKPKTQKVTSSKKKLPSSTQNLKPIRPTPIPKISLPFSSPDYAIQEEPESSEDEETEKRGEFSPPPLPPTPPGEEKSAVSVEATALNASDDLDSIPSSDDKPGKVLYKVSSSHYRPVGWGFIKISIIGLCTTGLIGIIFALLSTKHLLDLKADNFKYGSDVNGLGRKIVPSVDEFLNNSKSEVCNDNPPVRKSCVNWDWDEVSREKGVVIIYQCSNKLRTVSLIVMCQYRNWTVIKNVSMDCFCDERQDVSEPMPQVKAARGLLLTGSTVTKSPNPTVINSTRPKRNDSLTAKSLSSEKRTERIEITPTIEKNNSKN